MPVSATGHAALTRLTGPGLWASLPVLAILGPLLPGLCWALAPALDGTVWADLWADGQWRQAVQATLVSAALGTALACVLAGAIAMAGYPGPGWTRLLRRLPLLLSVPHAALAIGLLFLLAPSGWLARLLAPLMGWTAPPDLATVQDPHGLALALALGLKECAFLLWVLAAALAQQAVQRQLVIARSLGYSRTQAWCHVLWPQLLPRLAWPLAAVLAYSLSVVDMAVVLGPNNPPTLAVLAWRWLTDPDPALQARGAAAALCLPVLWLALGSAAWAGWRGLAWARGYPSGRRRAASHLPGAGLLPTGALLLPSAAVVLVLALWSVADGWFFPARWPEALSLVAWSRTDWAPVATSLWLAAAACALCLPVGLLWLEWGPKRFTALLYLPLVLPALPLVAGQYAVLLALRLDGSALGLLWSHLMWVLPYLVLSLAGPYRAFDPRLMCSARALGQSRLRACLRVKWPLLARPMLAALAVGFAVSVAQHLPTLFAGGGRFATVTTEAVALSAGGDRRVLAQQALLQLLLPLAAFALAALAARWLGRRRQGLA